MDWWQIVLIVLASIGTGVLAGGLLSYIIARVLKKPFINKREAAAVVEQLLRPIAPDLNVEIEKNRTIASERWTGKFLLFHTHAWEARQDGVPTLPTNLREDITQAYVDIRLANSVVWLSTELGCSSHNLDEKYTQLCSNIATRFDRIVPLLKHSGS